MSDRTTPIFLSLHLILLQRSPSHHQLYTFVRFRNLTMLQNNHKSYATIAFMRMRKSQLDGILYD
ncbi:hypothetical protein [Nostoc sp. TCL26-01]|uniref:hypothetical protein n=1 Tax=Nostoc sp. TCL26-01 TaxID=2576904 RepID=UPI0015BEF13C|nr:hypothetical protein [Nostoc sp. TCL26-01]QLE56535.1 hypothetical protein FD725_14020 [Nostoc sp. TCL26-01]